jgi:uncharacterized Fe-S cluster protein YjdI/ribosomal protein S18 acetylase RimI-like enzyme
MGKPLQVYDTDAITVTFDPNICRHTGVCLRTLPAVFDVRRKRWIQPEAGPAVDVAMAVRRCPSGALQYARRAFSIRPGIAGDALELARFGERAFREAFTADNRPENVEAYVGDTYSAARQLADLADAERVTLVVEVESSLIAYAQLRAGTPPSCVTGPDPVELLRFYVDRRWHGRGVAQALMAEALAAARARSAETVWLGVWERNPRAIAFYAKSGFRDVGSQPFMLGADRQTDRIMTLALADR